MSAPILLHRHMFGVKSDVTSGALHHLDEHTVLYVAGHTLILYNSETRSQKFIHGSDMNGQAGRCEIVALAVSPNKKYVAVSERSYTAAASASSLAGAAIHIYDLRTLARRKSLHLPEMRAREFVALAFSPSDGKQLLALSAGPDVQLTNWLWAKSRLLQQFKFDAYLASNAAAQANGGVGAAQQQQQQQQQSSADQQALTHTGGGGGGAIVASTDESVQRHHTFLSVSWSPDDATLCCVSGQRHVLFLRVPALNASVTNAANEPASPVGSAHGGGGDDEQDDAPTNASPTTSKPQQMTALTKMKRLETHYNKQRTTANNSVTAVDYTTHAFVTSQQGGKALLLVGTSDGRVELFDPARQTWMSELQLQGTLPLHDKRLTDSASSQSQLHQSGANGAPFDAMSYAPKCIASMTQWSGGLLIGCDQGVIKSLLFGPDPSHAAKQHESGGFVAIAGAMNSFAHLSRAFTVEQVNHVAPRVVCLSTPPSGEHLCALTSSCQLQQLRHFHTDVLASSDMHPEPLLTSFHSGAITAMDVCIRKPIVVTASLDRSVRVWNYITRQCELVSHFAEPAHTLSLHPSGLQVLIGFADKLRLCNLLADDIRSYKELPIKQCTQCCFANGGHLFAATNVGLIQVYNSYTCEQVMLFRGHTGAIRSLYWSLDDQSIISAGSDGAVYQRKLGHQQRASEHVQKGCKFTSALLTEDERILAVGDDRQLKEIVEKNVSKTLDAGVVLTQLAISRPPQRMLFAGTMNGVVRAFAFPLTGIVKDYQAHCRSVTALRVTHDDAFVFSASEDGTLAMFAVREADGRQIKRQHAAASLAEDSSAGVGGSTLSGSAAMNTTTTAMTTTNNPGLHADEILIAKSDLEEKTALMSELRSKIDELTTSNEYQLRLHDMNFSERIKSLNEKNAASLAAHASQCQRVKDEKNAAELQLDAQLEQTKHGHLNVLHALDVAHQKQIMRQVTQYQKLQAELETLVYAHSNQMQQNAEAHRRALAHQAQVQSDQLTRAKTDVQHDLQLQAQLQAEFVETKRQLELDLDTEIERLKAQRQSKLSSERDVTLRLKGENGIMKKKFLALTKDIEEQKENIRMMQDKELELQAHTQQLEHAIQRYKSEIQERDATIGANERAIYELKRSNAELEKYKFVLDYQIKELKKQIEPRENEIGVMKERIASTDTELQRLHASNDTTQHDSESIHASVAAKQQLCVQHKSKYRRLKSQLDAILSELEQLLSCIQEPQKLQRRYKELCDTYCRDALILLHDEETKQQQLQLQLQQSQQQQGGGASAASAAAAGGGALTHNAASGVSAELVHEYARHRSYLVRTVALLQHKAVRDARRRAADNLRVMQENVALIKEINVMRREIKQMHQMQRQRDVTSHSGNSHAIAEQDAAAASSNQQQQLQLTQQHDDWNADEARQLVQMQKSSIAQLRSEIDDLHSKLGDKQQLQQQSLGASQTIRRPLTGPQASAAASQQQQLQQASKSRPNTSGQALIQA